MKYILICTTLLISSFAHAQLANEKSENKATFELGNGLNIDFKNGDYSFNLGGMIQPSIGSLKDSSAEADYLMNSRRTYFHIGGKAKNEKVEFFIQTDFSLASPLLDAWVAFQPHKTTTITFGQMQTIANNREMQIMEDHLQFIDRSLLSSAYSNTGREFGLFVTSKLPVGAMAFVPQIAVTSGDGRSSFGADSRDVDLGGLKYAARLDFYPMGLFSTDNDKQIMDLMHEAKPKLAVGMAASYNDGASDYRGEGHGNLALYNLLGKAQLPDYRQVYSDIVFKYKGFSFLGEYAISTAKGLQGAYLNETASAQLIPTQISELLSLGSGYNTQLGYVTRSGYGFDVRYAAVTPEFNTNANSIIKDQSAITLGLTKYVKQNSLKLHAAVTSIDQGDYSTLQGVFMVQVVF